MRYEELKDAVNHASDYLSEDAKNVLDYVLDTFSECKDFTADDVYNYVNEELDSYFIYYSDAWNYLRDNNITDFKEAIDECACSNICQFAYYYCYQEIIDNLCL